MGQPYAAARPAAQPCAPSSVGPASSKYNRRQAMQIDHDAMVLVADVRNMLFFRN